MENYNTEYKSDISLKTKNNSYSFFRNIIAFLNSGGEKANILYN